MIIDIKRDFFFFFAFFVKGTNMTNRMMHSSHIFRMDVQLLIDIQRVILSNNDHIVFLNICFGQR